MNNFDLGIDTYTQRWSGKYRHIGYQIVFWQNKLTASGEHDDMYPDGGTWNTYIVIQKASIPKEFDALIPPIKKWRKAKFFDYNRLDDLFMFNGGATFFELLRDEGGGATGFKIGDDYGHIWDKGGYDVAYMLGGVKNSIDKFIECYPKYKAWSVINGHWIIADNLEAYNKKAREKMNSKDELAT